MVTIRRRDMPELLTGLAVAGTGAARAGGEPHQDEGLSVTAEAIHQEIAFAAPCPRVYATLTGTSQFDAVVRMSDAAKSMKLGTTPTAIDPVEGGAFVLFGGHISGRTIELVPDTRIVQAWREKTWPEGIFSLVRFALSDVAGGKTNLSFDDTGFPAGAGHHLTIGWYENYWESMRKYLSETG